MREELEQRVARAKQDKAELDRLLSDYLPFIRKKMAGITRVDLLTVAMLAFIGSVKQYDEARGSFLSFASLCIERRLADELKKEARYSAKVMPLFLEDGDGNRFSPAETQLSMAEYSRELERQSLAAEIQALSVELRSFGISFAELPRICPRQERSRMLCAEAARVLVGDEAMRANLLNNRRISQAMLAEAMGVSVKTMEKHRKYIVTMAILLLGDYPGIQAFLPAYREVIG